jgi:predicted nuclease with TOPRIM domain
MLSKKEIADIEKYFLLSELEEVNEPYKLLGEQSGYLLEMLQEAMDYGKKHPSERITASKKRLFTLLDINTRLGKIVSYNANLKATNKHLYGEVMTLRKKNKELEAEVEKLAQVDTL